MRSLEKRLRELKIQQKTISVKEEKLIQTIQVSKKAFYEAEDKRTTTYFEFLWEQGKYIKKHWWAIQLLLLASFWYLMMVTGGDIQTQRNMGVLASLFVIIMIPEFWKNRMSGAMEIEGATFYSLRQIYAARMCLFALVDVVFLVLFLSVVSFTTQITIKDMLLQFFLPLNVNCCICCRILFSKKFGTEYVAVSLSLLWAAIWALLIWDNKIFSLISVPILLASLAFSTFYLIFCFNRIMKSCDKYWEVDPLWNWF